MKKELTINIYEYHTYNKNYNKKISSIVNKIEEKYFDMLIFDSLINQSERNLIHYGILCDKDTKRYSLAPLKDNIREILIVL